MDRSPRRFQQGSLLSDPQQCQLASREELTTSHSASPSAPRRQQRSPQTNAVQQDQAAVADGDPCVQTLSELNLAAIPASRSKEDAGEATAPLQTANARQTSPMPLIAPPAPGSVQTSQHAGRAPKTGGPMPKLKQDVTAGCKETSQHADRPPKPGEATLKLKQDATAGCQAAPSLGDSGSSLQGSCDRDQQRGGRLRAVAKAPGAPSGRPGWSIAKPGTLQGRQRPETQKQAPAHPKQVGHANSSVTSVWGCHGQQPAASSTSNGVRSVVLHIM